MFFPSRDLGRTRFRATQLGVGDVADRSLPVGDCVATLQRALDAGINVIDTAPNYEDGLSEHIVGKALRGRRRDSVFVIDKVDHLHAPVAPQVDASLARLQLAHVDLFVFHACSTLPDLQRLLEPGGGFDQLDDVIHGGRARFRGISSHHPGVLVHALHAGVCDVVMFPIGPFADSRYEEYVLPLARARGVGTVCFKTFGAGKLLGDTEGYQRPLAARTAMAELPRLTVDECVRYTLTANPDVALLGLSTPAEQDAAFAAASAFEPMNPSDLAALRERAARAIAGKGEVWWNPPA
ncbi:MAG TPA: aldo/keto reductase [Planctomycetota bacterium]